MLAFAVPYMRPDEKRTPVAWRVLQAVCVVVMLISFVSAFRGYDGPRLAVSNVTRRSGSSVIEFSKRIEEADRFMVDSFQAVSTLLESKTATVEVSPALELVEQGIRTIESAPRIDQQSDKFRERLKDLLTQQKDMLAEFAQSPTKNRTRMRQEEEAIISQHNRFVSDYSEWWPAFLKEHGYQTVKESDR